MRDVSPETIRSAVKARADEIVEWVKTLVRFPSENRPPHGSEGPAQEFIAEECTRLSLEVDVFLPDEVPGITDHPSWLAGRDYGSDRRNVVARWKGAGGGRSILLSSHTDVAPFEPDNWQVCRPFEPVVKEGRLYGRGSADMKGGMGAAFWALRVLKDIGFEPRGDVLFEAVVDEEFASGNGTLAARVRGHNADLAVIPEPTGMEVCRGSLGAFLGDLTLTGKAGMPYTGTAIANPIHGAARCVELLSEWQAAWRAENRHALFEGPGKALNVLPWHITSDTPGEFTQMGTPLSTTISWIVWCHPGMSEAEFYRRFRAFWAEHAAADEALKPFALEVKPTYHYVKPWETPADDPGVRAVADAFEHYAGRAATTGGAPYSCDLAVYGEVGAMPAVLLGPRGDSLHGPDECVEIEDILALTGIYATLVSQWCNQEEQET